MCPAGPFACAWDMVVWVKVVVVEGSVGCARVSNCDGSLRRKEDGVSGISVVFSVHLLELIASSWSRRDHFSVIG